MVLGVVYIGGIDLDVEFNPRKHVAEEGGNALGYAVKLVLGSIVVEEAVCTVCNKDVAVGSDGVFCIGSNCLG